MRRSVPIHDPADPRIAAYVGVKERDLVGRQGRFLAEGEVVLRVLLTHSQYGVESLFLEERRAVSLGPLLEAVPAGAPIYVAPQAVLDGVAGFAMHRGVLAVGLRGPVVTAPQVLAPLSARALVVALEGVVNHDNVGGIFRNAAAFGADAVLLDDVSCDPLYRKAIRVSVGGALKVPHGRAESAEALLDALHAANFEVLALTPSREAEELETVCRAPFARPVALFCGAEGPGLSPSTLARTRPVRIPMAPGFDSLNVAVASGIALAALARVAGRVV